MKIKYKGWNDLFVSWAKGETEIVPCRSRWPYRVEDDILVCEEGSKQKHAVGIPATETKPRLFYYLVSHWRERLVDREKIESFGGVPIMPFELADALDQMDRTDLAPLCAINHHQDDPGAFLFIQEWLSRVTRVDRSEVVKDAYRQWRKYVVPFKGDCLYVTRRDRQQEPATTKVAEWSPDERVLRLLSQAYRSPAINWVKDAVYVAASRALGFGTALSLRRMGDVSMGGKSVPTKDTVIPVKATPSYLIKAAAKG